MNIEKENFRLFKTTEEETMTDEQKPEDQESACAVELRRVMSVDSKEYEEIKEDLDKLDVYKKGMFAKAENIHKGAASLEELKALQGLAWQIFHKDKNFGGDNHVLEKMQNTLKHELVNRIKSGEISEGDAREALSLNVSRYQKKLAQEGNINVFNKLYPDAPYDGPVIEDEPPFTKAIEDIDSWMVAVATNPERLKEAKDWLFDAYDNPGGDHLRYVKEKNRLMVLEHRFTELVNANIENNQLEEALVIILKIENDLGSTRDDLERKLMDIYIKQGDLEKAEEIAEESLYKKSREGRLKKINEIRQAQ